MVAGKADTKAGGGGTGKKAASAMKFSHGDPLALLRRYSMENRLEQVRIKDDRVEFEQKGGLAGPQKQVFDRKTKTLYRSQKGRGEPYQLDALVLFLKHKDANRKEYMSTVSQYGVAFVSTLDKADLVAYLTGKVETVAAIQVEEVRPSLFDTMTAEGKPGEGLAPGAAAAAKAKSQASFGEAAKAGAGALAERAVDPSVFEIPSDPAELLGRVRDVEKNLHDHSSILMCPVQTFDLFLPVASQSIQAFKKQEQKKLVASEMESKGARKPGQGGMEAGDGRGNGGNGANPAVKVNPRTGLASTSDVRMQFEKEAFTANRFGEANLDINEYGNTGAQAQKISSQPQTLEGLATMDADGNALAKDAPAGAKPSSSKRDKRDRDHRKKRERDHGSSSRHRGDPAAKKVKARKEPKPIILVPPGFSCILNRYNSRQFLTDGVFRTWEDAKQRMKKGLKVQSAQPLERTFARKELRIYKLTDQLPQSSQDWKRVCAVIVTGKTWQFKDYPFAGVKEGNLADLFTNICGFYFHYSDQPIPKDVEKWNVKPIGISKNNRHKDIAAFRDFWTKLDQFLDRREPKFPFRY